MIRQSTIERYTTMVLAWERDNKSRGITAETFCQERGTPQRTLTRAIAWFDAQRWNIADRDVLEAHIQALRGMIKKLERSVDNLREQGEYKLVAILAKVALDYRTRLMNVQGIYEQKLNIQHSVDVTMHFDRGLDEPNSN